VEVEVVLITMLVEWVVYLVVLVEWVGALVAPHLLVLLIQILTDMVVMEVAVKYATLELSQIKYKFCTIVSIS
jgi:hypothetical protein